MVLCIKTGLKDLKESGYYAQFRKLNQRAFKAKGLDFVPEFFDDLHGKDIAYILLNVDGKSNSAIASMLALFEQSDEIMKEYGLEGEYIVIDKIAVQPDKWDNGILSSMMYVAKNIGFGQKQQQIPILCRTSESETSEKYLKFSDFEQPFTSNGYYVHGFGFYNSQGQPLYKNPIILFAHMAGIVAAKPPTLVQTNPGLISPSPELTERLTT